MPLPPNPKAGRPYTGSLPPLAVFNEPERFTRIEGPDGEVLAVFEDGVLHYRNEARILELCFPTRAEQFQDSLDYDRATPSERLDRMDASTEGICAMIETVNPTKAEAMRALHRESMKSLRQLAQASA